MLVHEIVHLDDEVGALVDPPAVLLVVPVHSLEPRHKLLLFQSNISHLVDVHLGCLAEIRVENDHLVSLEFFVSLHFLKVAQSLVFLCRCRSVFPLNVLILALRANFDIVSLDFFLMINALLNKFSMPLILVFLLLFLFFLELSELGSLLYIIVCFHFRVCFILVQPKRLLCA